MLRWHFIYYLNMRLVWTLIILIVEFTFYSWEIQKVNIKWEICGIDSYGYFKGCIGFEVQ